jgi:hypothetical protein
MKRQINTCSLRGVGTFAFGGYMSAATAFVSGITEIDGATLALVTLICGATVWIIRNHVSSVFVLLIVFPVAFVSSLFAYHACHVIGLFNIKNMGEWLIWTIMAASGGTMLTLGLTVAIGSMLDRDESGSTAPAR